MECAGGGLSADLAKSAQRRQVIAVKGHCALAVDCAHALQFATLRTCCVVRAKQHPPPGLARFATAQYSRRICVKYQRNVQDMPSSLLQSFRTPHVIAVANIEASSWYCRAVDMNETALELQRVNQLPKALQWSRCFAASRTHASKQ